MKQLTIIIALFYSLTAKSQVYIKNTGEKPISFAILYNENRPEFEGYVSVGWVKLVPGETYTFDHDKLHEGRNGNGSISLKYYIKGTKVTKVSAEEYIYEGKMDAWVLPGKNFSLLNADKEYVKKENTTAIKVTFTDLGGGGFLSVQNKATFRIGN